MKCQSVTILLTFLLLLGGSAAAQQTFAVITHPSVGADQLTKSEVADVFLGKMTIVGGSAVKLFILPPDHAVSQRFFETALQTTANRFHQTWLRNAFSGGGATPSRMGSNAEVIRAVAATPGAIGYIAMTSATSLSGCKVVYSE